MTTKRTTLSLLSFCCLLFQNLTAAIQWSAPSDNVIPAGSVSTDFANVVSPVYCPSSNQVVQVWSDSSNALYYAVYNGTSWSAPSNNAIPLSASSGANQITNPVYFTSSNELVLVWQDHINHNCYYAIYDGTSWSAPLDNAVPFGASPSTDYANNPVYDTSADELVLTWLSGTAIYYSTYDGTSWTTPGSNQIPLGGSAGVNGDGFAQAVYDSSSSQLMQVWLDSTDPTVFYYATYNGSSWSASGSSIPQGASPGGVYGEVYDNPAYDPSSNQIILVWQDPDFNLYYATYNGSSWSASGSNQIPIGSSAGVGINNFSDLIFDSFSNQMVLIWKDISDFLALYYASFDGTSWSAPIGNQIPLGASSGAINYENPFFVPLTNELLSIWNDSTNFYLYYASYDGSNWTAPTDNQIPPGAAAGVDSLYSAIYDSNSSQGVQVWSSGANLYYAVYGDSSSLPTAPASFSGSVIKNKFLTQTDRIYKLVWTPSSDATVVRYLLRRNGVLIDTVPAGGTYRYLDHNRNAKVIDVYTLTSQNESGIESNALTVTFY